ncbi:hypothetical protein [Rhodanobacter denitrificans]|uniref:hypothetical protein n=1 Tax=Rhodanobacter denitrificans TaxID=666685 RepID=UPI0012FDAC7C|nr:hypothetical protein [Rhodanobacter denitrificans]UJM88437.1 hypothetical protein LRJ86_09185 [Rhodanobacter denitrificans]
MLALRRQVAGVRLDPYPAVGPHHHETGARQDQPARGAHVMPALVANNASTAPNASRGDVPEVSFAGTLVAAGPHREGGAQRRKGGHPQVHAGASVAIAILSPVRRQRHDRRQGQSPRDRPGHHLPSREPCRATMSDAAPPARVGSLSMKIACN